MSPARGNLCGNLECSTAIDCTVRQNAVQDTSSDVRISGVQTEVIARGDNPIEEDFLAAAGEAQIFSVDGSGTDRNPFRRLVPVTADAETG